MPHWQRRYHKRHCRKANFCEDDDDHGWSEIWLKREAFSGRKPISSKSEAKFQNPNCYPQAQYRKASLHNGFLRMHSKRLKGKNVSRAQNSIWISRLMKPASFRLRHSDVVEAAWDLDFDCHSCCRERNVRVLKGLSFYSLSADKRPRRPRALTP